MAHRDDEEDALLIAVFAEVEALGWSTVALEAIGERTADGRMAIAGFVFAEAAFVRGRVMGLGADVVGLGADAVPEESRAASRPARRAAIENIVGHIQELGWAVGTVYSAADLQVVGLFAGSDATVAEFYAEVPGVFAG
uniref:Uncharacterized protein n=1 Tax=Marseillevirus LCMAC103 TaxID=2506604 RepID=A0A481YUQ5_9VIRU|nr:MAG: hypothetical protein LCMAC103_00910 [Marseillevirus LCMAC103]